MSDNPSAARFPTTCWGRVLQAGDPAAPESRAALEALCRDYWYPLYAFIRRKGHGPETAQDLVPAFAGKPIDREALFWEHEGNWAVRVGRWTLVAVRGKPWELYDLEADRTEKNDLASKRPETVAALSARWDDGARRSGVLPFPPGGTARKK